MDAFANWLKTPHSVSLFVNHSSFSFCPFCIFSIPQSNCSWPAGHLRFFGKTEGIVAIVRRGSGRLHRVKGNPSIPGYAFVVVSDNLPLKVALHVYRSLYESHILYSCAIWGAAQPKLLKPILGHHTKATKLLLGFPRASHLSKTLYQRRVLKPEQIIMRENVKLVRSCRMKCLPHLFCHQ